LPSWSERSRCDDRRQQQRTPSQAGNLLSALRGLTTWIKDHDPPYLTEDDDPTLGLKTGKLAARRVRPLPPMSCARRLLLRLPRTTSERS
jgi:hypothetical protein